MGKNLVMQQLAGIRREMGNGFIAALDDIRQKVVEEGWSGRTATTAHELRVELSDPMAALYGKRDAAPEAATDYTPAERYDTAHAYNQARAVGAERTVHEIEAMVPASTLEWLRGPEADPGRDPLGRTHDKPPTEPARAAEQPHEIQQEAAEL